MSYPHGQQGDQRPLASTSALSTSTDLNNPSSSASSAPHPAERAQGPSSQSLRRRGPNTVPWYRVVHLLDNKGSVARDHLAAERTYLAWLRTSLSLASIGIAITQLFRLGTVATAPPSSPSLTAEQIAALASSSSASQDTLTLFYSLLNEQEQRLNLLESGSTNPTKYRHLGKPVGGTFIALALLFLVLGTRRYFKVQNALMLEPSKFPPSRRSVAFSTLTVAILTIAAFAAIMATK